MAELDTALRRLAATVHGHGALIHGGRTRDEHHRLGRAAAAVALAAAGAPTTLVSGRPGGPPVWPAGTLGSISHTDGTAVAVVVSVELPATSSVIAGIGVDLERLDRLPDADAAFVLAPDELVDTAGRAVDPTVPWAVKEAAFKAVSGATPGGLDGLDPSVIRVRLAADGTAAVVVGPAAGTVTVMGAHWCVADGFVLAVVAVTLGGGAR